MKITCPVCHDITLLETVIDGQVVCDCPSCGGRWEGVGVRLSMIIEPKKDLSR